MESLNALIPLEHLEMHVMPIVRFRATPAVSFWHRIGLEALARGPVGSPLRSPVALFAEARAQGLEQELDLACLARALPLLRRIGPGQRLFVNVGPETLLHPGFMPTMEAYLPSGGPCQLVLEVLEGPLTDLPALTRVLNKVVSLGVAVAIDDVSISEAELVRVQQLPMAQYLKIDREVMMGHWPDNPTHTREWLRELQRIATIRDAQVLMEGIEPAGREALVELNRLGVVHGQGFLFGAPSPHLPDEPHPMD